MDKSCTVRNVQASADECDNGVHEACRSTGPPTSKVAKTNSRGVGNGCFLCEYFPASALTLSFPTVKSRRVFVLESDIDRLDVSIVTYSPADLCVSFYLTIAACSTSSVDCKQLNSATANAEFAFQSSPLVHHSLSAPPAALEFLTAGLRSLFNHLRKSESQLQVNAVNTRSPTPTRPKLWRSAIAVNQKAVQLHRKI